MTCAILYITFITLICLCALSTWCSHACILHHSRSRISSVTKTLGMFTQLLSASMKCLEHATKSSSFVPWSRDSNCLIHWRPNKIGLIEVQCMCFWMSYHTLFSTPGVIFPLSQLQYLPRMAMQGNDISFAVNETWIASWTKHRYRFRHLEHFEIKRNIFIFYFFPPGGFLLSLFGCSFIYNILICINNCMTAALDLFPMISISGDIMVWSIILKDIFWQCVDLLTSRPITARMVKALPRAMAVVSPTGALHALQSCFFLQVC